jgi:lysophospholipase L1-like esterase
MQLIKAITILENDIFIERSSFSRVILAISLLAIFTTIVVCPARAESILLNDPVAKTKAFVTIKKGGVIVAEGDSLTYGADFSHRPDCKIQERSPTPYPEELAVDLKNQVTVENRGYNGDRSIDGLMRWQNAESGNLVLLMYGTNDCGNYGRHPEGALTVSTYHAMLKALIERRQHEGATVVVLLPPPIGNLIDEKKLQAYRKAAIEVAHEMNANFFDTSLSLKNIENPWSDRLHLKPEAYQALAADIARHIKVQP